MKKFLLALILSVATLQPVSAQSYRGFADIEGGILMGPYSNDPFIGLTTSHGIQLVEKFFIGAGTGILTNTNNEVMPIFCDLRFDWWTGKKASPFIDLKAGYTLLIITHSDYAIGEDLDNGLYLNPTVGCRIRLNEKIGINIGLAYNTYRYVAFSRPYHTISIKAGIDF